MIVVAISKRFVFAAVTLTVILAIGWTIFGATNNPTESESESTETVRLPFGSTRGPEPPHIVRLGRFLERKGFEVSEHPKFGGVCWDCHSPDSAHHDGHAIDVNSVRDEYDRLTQLAIKLKHRGWIVLWQVPDHYDHLHVERR